MASRSVVKMWSTSLSSMLLRISKTALTPRHESSRTVSYTHLTSLCISGKRRDAPELTEAKTVYSERRSKNIFRVLDLPCEIDPNTVNATVSDGLLELRLSKVRLGKKVPVLTRAAAA